MICRGEGGWVGVGRALMVARWWRCDRVPPTGEHSEQDAGDHQGPPFPAPPPSPLRRLMGFSLG